ncbi:MarR family winged helix-turn-helix transcriptional regulator [Prauserella alba]|uniref:MarR family transcriptional regulator n=1 Tax=Prauserella alba TaxID=176898 RepID=A0ABP4FXX8_9PSEU|nr:MarR family transcriptional regulator [Prauserella alba]MCP2178905.1 DNA-binding transcriptional regulator, MarR family [Prauserella alba]
MARKDTWTTPDAVDLITDQWRRSRPELDVSALAVFGRLHRNYHRYQAFIGETFAEYGISMGAFDVLAALRRSSDEGRLNAGALAQQTLVTTGGLTQRVNQLEKSGLVRRERDTDDGRIVYVALTEEGAALIDKLADEHFSNEQAMLVGLSKSERKQLAHLLHRLERSMELCELTERSE